MGLGLKLWLCPDIVTTPNIKLDDMYIEHRARCEKKVPNISGAALTWYISCVQLCMHATIQSGMSGSFWCASANEVSENDLSKELNTKLKPGHVRLRPARQSRPP